jgi:foldase protein PrsA
MRHAVAWVLVLVAVVATACNGSSSASTASSASSGGNDPVALVVNGTTITRSQLALLAADVRFRHGTPEHRLVVREAIDSALIQQEAKRRGVSVPAAAVERAYQAAGGESAKAALAAYGIPLSHLRDRLEQGLLAEALAKTFAPATIPESALRARYHRDRAKFHTPEIVRVSTIQVRNAIQGRFVIRRLNDGANFDTLARQISIDPAVQQSGPDQGWKAPGLLPEPARTQLESTPVGQVVPTLVRIQASYLVVKITGRRQARTASFSEVRVPIKKTMTRELAQASFERWLQSSRRSADVQVKQ